MKREIFTILLVISLFVSNHSLFGQFSGGSGTLGDPYLIADTADLNDIRGEAYLQAYFRQTDNIVFESSHFTTGGKYYNSGAKWAPIAGNGSSDIFTGQYDGDGHSITGLEINRGGNDDIGLFGHIGRGGVIKNVKLVTATVVGGRGTGALVGRVTGDQSTRIEYCSAIGTVEGDAATGGLVGSNNSYITNNGAAESFRPVIYGCYANVNVSLRTGASITNMIKFGGMAGCNQKGMISNSYSRGSVTVNHASAARIGGFAGCVEKRGVIVNSYSTGAVSGTGASNVGGFLGMVGTGSDEGRAINCYFDNQTSVVTASAAGTGMVTADMKSSSKFNDWDFTYIWSIGSGNDGYPDLMDNPAAATEFIWNGLKDTNWADAANWVGGVVPSEGSEVKIPSAGVTHQPSISSSVTLKNLILESSRELTISSGVNLTVTDTISCSSTEPIPVVDGAGTLVLGGSILQELPNGSYSNLTIDNYNNVKMTGNITVSGNLTMTNGLLDLNGYTITLGESATLSEIEQTNYSSRIFGTGSITTTRTLTSPSSENVAGLGFVISSSANLGTTTIARGHTELDGASSSKSILRWYNVSPALNTGLNATVVFNYSMSELTFTSTEAPAFSLFKRPIGGTAEQWVDVESTAGTKTLTATGVDGFSTWTAASSATPMPIVLLSFEAQLVQSGVELKWVTASELNNDYFTIERSTNGIDFESVEVVTGAGTSNQANYYSTMDYQPLPGVSYYRLKQTDYNGEFEYSKIVSVNNSENLAEAFQVFPNPCTNQLYLMSGSSQNAEYRLYDLNGKNLACGHLDGMSQETINTGNFSPGIYNLIIISDRVATNYKIFVK
jgi:hypothetical protein